MADFTNRQKEIIEASIRLIDKNGIQNLTIKHLAEEMKISEPAIYRHFESKFDILLAILENFNEETKQSLAGADISGKNGPEKIKYIFTKHMDIFTKNPSLASVVFSEEIFQNDKRLSEMVYGIMKSRISAITAIIKTGQKEGTFRNDIPAKLIALALTGSLRLIVTDWRLSGRSFDLREAGRKMWEALEIMTLPGSKE